MSAASPVVGGCRGPLHCLGYALAVLPAAAGPVESRGSRNRLCVIMSLALLTSIDLILYFGWRPES